MKYLAPAALLAVAAMASPVPDAASADAASADAAAAKTSKSFAITDFYNSGSPHSTTATVSFKVSDLGAGAANVANVSCSGTASVQPTIAFVQFPHNCSNPDFMFGFQIGRGGYEFILEHQYTNGTKINSGSIYVPANTSTYQDPFNPNGNYQYLNHAKDFKVDYNSVTYKK